jgi:hypothetical protein
MLRAGLDRIYTDGEIGSIDLTCNQSGTVWGVAPYDVLGEPVLEGVGPTHCVALARALLALPAPEGK